MKNFEDYAWADYCVNHPSMRIPQACLNNVTPYQFWCFADNYPDLVGRMHIPMTLMGNFGLNCGVPWLAGTNGSLCLICKQGIEDVTSLKKTLIPYGSTSKTKPELRRQTRLLDGTQICNFISNLDRDNKVCCCLGVCHYHLITR